MYKRRLMIPKEILDKVDYTIVNNYPNTTYEIKYPSGLLKRNKKIDMFNDLVVANIITNDEDEFHLLNYKLQMKEKISMNELIVELLAGRLL